MSDVSFIIDYSTLHPGFGRVYQGAGQDIGLHQYPDVRKRMLVQMAADIGGIPTKNINSIVFMGIDDGPLGVLPDQTLISLARLFYAWLREGGDCTFGCVGGISRSSYMNIATMMMITGWPYQRCIDLLRTQRPQANPMPCFVEHLLKIEMQYKAVA